MSKKKYQQPTDLLQPGAEPEDLGLINTIQSLEQEDLSGAGVESAFAPRTYNVDYDAYDEYIGRPFSIENEDIDDLRAYNQTVGEKSRYGVQKLVGKTATAVVGGVGMLFHGLPNMLVNIGAEALDPEGNEGGYKDAFRSIFENDFQRSLDGVNEWMDGKLPAFYTKEEQEMGVWEQMSGGSANFWANDFVNGLSFVAGAILTEFATAGMATAIMPARATQFLRGVSRANSIERATTASGVVSKLGKASRVGQMADVGLVSRRLITGAGYESGVEARHHYDSTIKALEKAWREDNPNKEPTMEDKKGFHDLAVETTNGVFVGNLALVGAGNMIAFPRIFGSGYNASRRSVGKVIKDAGDDISNRYIAAYQAMTRSGKLISGGYTALKVPLYEGLVEEGGQALMDRGGREAALGFYADKRNPGTGEAIVGMVEEMYNNFAENYSDKHVQKEIALGFILGAMGLPGRAHTSEVTGEKSLPWQGGIYGQFQMRKEKRAGADALAKYMTENPSAVKAMKRNFDALNQSAQANNKMDYALMTNNVLSWKNAKHDHFFSYVHSRAKAGFYEDVISDINEIKNIPIAEFSKTFGYENQDLTTEELEQRRDKVIEKALDRAGEIRKATESVEQNFNTFNSDVQEMLIHSASVARDVDARTESVRKGLLDLGADLSALEDDQTNETQTINAYRAIAEQEGETNRIEALVRDFITQGADIATAYRKAFESAGLLAPANTEGGLRVNESEFSELTLRSEIYTTSQELLNLEKDLAKAMEENQGENYTQDKQARIDEMNATFNELKRRQGRARKSLEDGMESELTPQDVQVLQQMEVTSSSNFNENREDIVRSLIDLRKLRARRHAFLGLYNSLKTPQGQEEALQQVEDIVTSLQQAAVESEIENDFIRNLYSQFGNGSIFEFDYTNQKGVKTNYRAIFLNPKQIMILPSSVASNHLSRFKYEARLKELEGQTDKKSRDEVVKVKQILDKYFPEGQTSESVWEVDAIKEERMSNVQPVPMEEYRLELLKRAVRNVREQLFNYDVQDEIIAKEEEINSFFEDLIDIESLEEVPGVSIFELNERRIQIESLIEQHEASIRALQETKANIEREARHLDKILEYYNDPSLNAQEKYEKIIGISVMASIREEAKQIFTEFGLESDPVYGHLLKDTDMESLAIAIEDSEFMDTTAQDYVSNIENAITQYERALVDIKRTRDVIHDTMRAHAEAAGIVGAKELPIEWLVNLIDKEASNFFKEEIKLLEAERARIAQLLERKKREAGAREKATDLLQNLLQLKGTQAILVNQLQEVENFMSRFFQPPAEIIKEVDEDNPITQNSLFTEEESTEFFRYAPGLLNGVGFFKTAGYHKAALEEFNRIMALSAEQREEESIKLSLQNAISQIAYFKFVEEVKYPSQYLLKAVPQKDAVPGLVYFNDTEVKLMVVDAYTGQPIRDKDKNLIYTTMMEAYAWMPDGSYRFATSDFADPANPTAEELAEVDKRVQFYQDFKDGITASDNPMYFEITDKNNAIRIFEDNNYAAENSVVGRLVKNTNQLKDLNVIIAKAPKGEEYATINIFNRRLTGKNGMAYAIKNGQLVHLRPSKLANMEDVKSTVYNLLVQYAKNEEAYRTTQVNIKDVNKLEGSEQTIDAILKQYIYWGAQAKNRTLTEYSIFWQSGVLKFGGSQITHEQLMDPTKNVEIHDELKSFLSTLTMQIDRFSINSDITAREKANTASKGKKRVSPSYTKYIQTIVAEDGGVTTKSWKNYTEFLLSERNSEQPGLTTNIVEDINYTSDKKLIPNQRISTPQFLNSYLKFNGQSVALKTKKTKYKKEPDIPKQPGIGGLELAALEENKSYRIYGTITGQDSRTYIDAPVILTPVNGVDMLQFDVIGSIPQSISEADTPKLTARLNAINSVIQANQGVIPASLLSEINADFSSRGSNVQMALVNIGESDPLLVSKDTTGIDALSEVAPKVINIEELNLTQNEGPAVGPSKLDSFTEEEDDAPFLSAEYATIPKENYTTWDPIAENNWYNTVMPKDSKGKLLIPMEVMKNLIDGHAYGKLTKDGNILIAKDAIEGALYHEAFHGVTRLLMPTADRLALYDEVRKMKGKVTTYRGGEMKKMSSLTDKEADEWLAEEFREYRLSNGNYKVGQGRKLSLLDKFIEWLNSVLNFFTGSNSKAQELFNRIDNGGFSNATIINQNRAANVYLTPGEASFKRAVYDGMTPAFTDVAINNRDLSFYDFYDLDLSGKDAHKLAGIYGTVEEINRQIDSNGEYMAPMSVLKKLAIRTKKLVDQAVSPQEKAKIENNYSHITENWQSYVEGHLKYIKYFNININENSILEENEKNDISKQIMDKDETDPTKIMSTPLKLLIGSAPMVNKQGKAMVNELGFYKPVDFYDVVGYLYRALANSSTEATMIEKFTESIQHKPELKSIYHRLKLSTQIDAQNNEDISILNWGDVRMRLSFLNQFSQANDDYLIYLMEENGKDKYFINANVNKIESVIKREWEANLQSKVNEEGSPFAIADNGDVVLDKETPLAYRRSVTIGNKVQLDKPKTVKEWATSTWNFNDSVNILSNLGITLSNPAALNIDTVNEATSWILYELSTNEAPVSNLFNDSLDIKGRLNALVQEEVKHSSLGIDLSFQNHEGKTIFGVSKKTYLNIVTDKLNEMSVEELNTLQDTKANLRGSYWINLLKAGEKLKVSNLQGGRVDVIGQKGKHISKGTKGDITSLHMSAIMDGVIPYLRAADMKSEFAMGFGIKNHYHTYTEAVEILSNQLADEVRTSILLNSNGVGSNVSGYRENAKDLRYFKGIVTLPAHILSGIADDSVIKSYTNSDTVQAQLLDHVKAQMLSIENHLKEYEFVVKGKFGYANVGISNTQLTNLAEATSIKFDGKYISEGLLQAFVKQLAIAQIVNTIEMSKLILGDLALFTPSNIFKRTKLAAGSKTYPATGNSVNEWFNANMPRKYSKHSDELVSVVRKDIKVDAEFIEEYVQSVTEVFGDVAGENTRIAFTEMDEFDGGGFIHLDAQRSMSLKLEDWSIAQEVAFQRVEEGLPLTSETIAYFPDSKPQYFGDFQIGQLSLKTGYKFALFPIHENMVEPRSTLAALARNMREETIDIQVFESVSKIGGVVQPEGEFLDMYEEQSIQAVNKDTLKLEEHQAMVYSPITPLTSRHVLETGLMGMQVKQDAKLKYKTTVGTQERTQIKSNLYENGELVEEFADLEDTINLMDEAYEAITEKGIDELVAKTGLVLQEGKYVFSNNSTELIESFILDEMQSRDMSRHLTDSVSHLLSKDERFLDLLMSKPKIENLLMSLAVGSTVKQKTSGSMMVQRASSGLEMGAKAIKQKDFELNNKLEGIEMNPLKFYSKGENGVINAMQVMVPHHFKELMGLNPDINDGMFDARLFQLIGFRIPTETLASIEFIEVVGFLPEGYTSVVVPSAIVGKSGSDFDIDKLTLYFPNYEIVQGRYQKIPYLSGTSERAVMQRLEKIRTTEPATYVSLVSKLLPVSTRNSLDSLLTSKKTISKVLNVLKDNTFTKELIKEINATSQILRSNPSESIKEMYGVKLQELNLELLNLIENTVIPDMFENTMKDYQSLIDGIKGIKDKLADIDALLLPKFSELPIILQNTKKSLQNVVLDAHYKILSHPNNYANILTPIGASNFKDLRDVIQGLKINRGKQRLLEINALTRTLTASESAEVSRLTKMLNTFEDKNWSQVLSFTNIINKSSNMWSGLGGVGVAAVNSVDHVRGQQIGLQVNPLYLKENPNAGLWFEGFSPNTINLGRRKNSKQTLNVSTALSELANGYVDVTADDWVYMVNAGLEFAPAWTTYLRAGLDIMTFGLFMNQPIIDKFIETRNIKQSAFRNTFESAGIRFESNSYIIENLRKELKKAAKIPNRLLNDRMLATQVGKSIEVMNSDELAIQLQVINMLEAQMKLSDQTSLIHKATAYDTNTPKDRSAIKYREVLRKVLQEEGVFIDRNGRDAVNSILELPVLKGFNQATHTFPKLFEGLFATEAIENYSTIAENFIRQGIKEDASEEDIIYRLNRFENHIITHTLHDSALNSENNTKLKSRARYLMQGLSSLPRRVSAYKKSMNNLLLDELHPILQPHTNNKHPEFSVDNLMLRRKKLAPRDLEILGDSFLELYNKPSTKLLAEEILYFSLLQSGVNFSSISIFHAIPDHILIDMAENVVGRLVGSKVEWPELINSFYANSWKDGRISTYVGRSKLRQFTGFKKQENQEIIPVGNSQKGFEEGFLGVKTLSRDANKMAMTVSVPLVSNKQLAEYRKAGKTAPKTTKIFIKTSNNINVKGVDLTIFAELDKKGNGNRHIETGYGSIHSANKIIDAQFVPSTVQPLGLKSVRQAIAKGDISKLVLNQDLKTQAGGDGIIKTVDNAVLKLRKLGAYTRQQLSKDGVKKSLGISTLDNLMEQAGLINYPYYSKIFAESSFVKTKTKGFAHIYEVEILNTGYYTSDNILEVKEENTGEETRNIVSKNIAQKTANQIQEAQDAIKKFEEDC